MSETQIVVKGRLSYAYLAEPRKGDDGTEGKYSTAVIIDKSDKKSLEKLANAIKAVKENPVQRAKLVNAKGEIPKGLKTPLHDGDETDKPECEGAYYFNTSSNNPVPIYASDRHLMTTEEARTEIYSGCYAQVMINLAGYNYNGSKGITAYLQGVMKWKDGERLGGGMATANDFEVLEDDSAEDIEDFDFGV